VRFHEGHAIDDEPPHGRAKWPVWNLKPSGTHHHIEVRVDTPSGRDVEHGSVRQKALEERDLERANACAVFRAQDRPTQPVLVRKGVDHLDDLALPRNSAGSSPDEVVVQLGEPDDHLVEPWVSGVVVHQQFRVLLNGIP
jgi:hypothetical protein